MAIVNGYVKLPEGRCASQELDLFYTCFSRGLTFARSQKRIPCGTAICCVVPLCDFCKLRAYKILILPASHGMFALMQDGDLAHLFKHVFKISSVICSVSSC